MTASEAIINASRYVRRNISNTPEIGLILGSGLGELADEMDEAMRIPYRDIPGFSIPTVEGHVGQLAVGYLSGVFVIAMQGRFHYYEGYSYAEMTFPIRVMRRLGVKTLLITNAAGAINPAYKPGDLMIITDHINFMGKSLLKSKRDDRSRQCSYSKVNFYDEHLQRIAEMVAVRQRLDIQKGVYVASSGPSYETPAEVRMLRVLGADAVGMSTVPEVLAANDIGMKVLAISCISNMAAGILDQPLTHDEVIKTTAKVKLSFSSFVKALIRNIDVEKGRSTWQA